MLQHRHQVDLVQFQPRIDGQAIIAIHLQPHVNGLHLLYLHGDTPAAVEARHRDRRQPTNILNIPINF